MNKPFFKGSEWTFEAIQQAYDLCEQIAKEDLGLTMYPNQLEVISTEQMLDAYSSHGLPSMYQHWSFGKAFVRDDYNYTKGHSGLAYEIVINSVPTINYLMQDNNMLTQTLVIAHAAFGHNSFFKNNYLFKTWTDAHNILEYCAFAKDYVRQCEELYGVKEVEAFLDACHAWQFYGVDKYKRPPKLNQEVLDERRARKLEEERLEVNELWRTLPNYVPEHLRKKKGDSKKDDIFFKEPEENILYFMEKRSPSLQTWQRELIRITRKLGQYFYPQFQTKVMNEGWATFCHYFIMTRLWEKGYLDDGQYLEFLDLHTAVVRQPDRSAQFNPYWLGFNMFMDIKRICEEPTAEDYEWFPDIAGKPWLPVLTDAMENYRDESFIRQFLSPKLMRDMRVLVLHDDSMADEYLVSEIGDDKGYRNIRNIIAKQYMYDNMFANIQIVGADLEGDRTLYLNHNPSRGMELTDDSHLALEYLQVLWSGYPVNMDIKDPIEDETER